MYLFRSAPHTLRPGALLGKALKTSFANQVESLVISRGVLQNCTMSNTAEVRPPASFKSGKNSRAEPGGDLRVLSLSHD